MTIFPTLSFLTGVNTVRTWHPRGPDEIEVWAFTIVDADASDEVKDNLRRSGSLAFSAAGLFEQDDAENWIEIQRVLRGHQARKQRFNVQMAIGREFGSHSDLPGRIGQVLAEEAARGFYAQWARMMTEPSWSTLKPQGARCAAE